MVETKVKIVMSTLNDKLMYVLASGELFWNYDPPCKECLINNMCIDDHVLQAIQIKGNSLKSEYIVVRYCQILKKFINNNEHFFYII